ncbi:MAG: HD domain-containing protein [Lachnospiraceae bacterium]|nr:HD domain-containing protein [Lachnospiraceae bacterium]
MKRLKSIEFNIENRINRSAVERTLCVVSGIAVNVLLAWLTQKAGLPLYFDTVGTFAVTFIGGSFPGIMTALLTNIIFTFFNDIAAYYSLINVLMAVCAAYIAQKNAFKDIKRILILILHTAFISGVLGAIIQWLLLGRPQYAVIADTLNALTSSSGFSKGLLFVFLSFLLNLIDKGVSVLLALFTISVFPAEMRERIINSGWHQRPLSDTEIEEMKKNFKGKYKSLQGRVFLIVIIVSVAIVAALAYIGMNLYFMHDKEDRTREAKNTAIFAANVLEPDRIDTYLKKGREATGYQRTEEMLEGIRENAADIEYLYVVRPSADGFLVAFDLKTDDIAAYEPGERFEYEEGLKPYIDDLLQGREIPPIESDDFYGWMMTAYQPVYNDRGRCVCYVGADVSLTYFSDFIRQFAVRAALIMSGFMVAIFACIMRVANYYMIYPIKSITSLSNRFVDNIDREDEVKKLNKDVGAFKKLNINTGDEVENLYSVLCTLTENVTEQLWEIQHYSDAVSKMQNGLIITMADMVENRDSDTGAHIQKTAEYVRIIANALKAKGYYAEKITPKYINDIVMSAPLHDVGKINISDKILNKPGKLNAEEYEIMKTHTTMGRMIMEKAISTISGDNYLKEARNMAGYHHEKWDGTGYPEGLHGEVIPLSARIMAVADVFDAVSSKRVYKPAIPFDQAVAIIVEGSGTHFDPKCVEAFLDSLTEVKRVLRKYREYEGEL